MAIVIFHASPKILGGGYVGVDIFFIISGFLITTILVSELELNKLNIYEFYCRRIRRIFPALITILLASFMAGWLFLLADEFELLGEHIAAGATFTSNFLLWQEVGYFDIKSESKPLLHLWSLAIEEQFYLVWPWLLMIGIKIKRLKPLVLIFTFLSLFLNLILIWYFPLATFYLPFTRFWELGVGAVIALYFSNLQSLSLVKKKILAVLGVVFVFGSIALFKADLVFPGFWVLIPVAGSALILLYSKSLGLLNSILSSRFMTIIGLISFPLYLWHWPLLVFHRILAQSHDNLSIGIAITLAVGLAVLTFQYIEKPLRSTSAQASARYLLIIMVIIFMLGIFTVLRDGFEFRKYSQYDKDMRWYSWVENSCRDKYGMEPCNEHLGRDEIFILGDSHANHLYPGLKALWKGGISNIGSCLPVNGKSILVDPVFTKLTTENDCFLQQTFKKQLEILIEKRPKYVVIGMAWNLYFESSDIEQFSSVDKLRYQIIQKELLATIATIQASGAKVVLVETIPRNEKLPKDLCGLRKRPEPQYCAIANDSKTKGISWQLLNDIYQKNPGVILIKIQDLFCEGAECQLIKNGKLLYRDEWHLSYSGSLLSARRILDVISAAR